jgi:uncharacterized protein
VSASDDRRLPWLAPIDAYGNGGFRFADMSHRGSLLCLPSGMRAWPVAASAEIDVRSLAPVMAEAGEIDILVVGAGSAPWSPPAPLKAALREAGISGVEILQTGAAVRIFNIVLAERRRVAAALIAVD